VKITIYFLLIIVFSFSIISFASDKPKKQGKLVVQFTGMTSSKGNVKIALCNSDTNYENHKSPFIGETIQINNNNAVIEFKDLPEGEYAIKAFHDEDANDDLNTNFLGIPVENYGFSNNARGMFGPPSWEDAKFRFNDDNKVVEIRIK
jgi:uncharacterized protein (DUF2141 family)